MTMTPSSKIFCSSRSTTPQATQRSTPNCFTRLQLGLLWSSESNVSAL